MFGNELCFVEWKEHFVSQERGNRVVHYFLKDSGGESILAVIGTERSVRHMFYVVADEFLEVHGKENSASSNYKWRSRREVVDWLTSMLSKQHLHGDMFGMCCPLCNIYFLICIHVPLLRYFINCFRDVRTMMDVRVRF